MTDGLTTTRVAGTVAEAVAALRASLDRRGIAVFATIDHAEGARTAGLALADEVVVVFGNPAVGTVLMQDRPDVGYELPLRLLLRADGERGTVAVYRDPRGLVEAYGLTTSAPVAEKLSGLLAQLVDELASGRS